CCARYGGPPDRPSVPTRRSSDLAPDHLARDRIPVEDEEMAALKESIRVHGQRTPIEVAPLGNAGHDTLPYGLISGWRRLAALKRSEEHTSELQSRENLVCRLLLE